MKTINNQAVKNSISAIASACLLLISINSFATSRDSSIANLLENRDPNISFSFSKNIVDFFDTDLDWNNGNKHIEGDFSKAAFYAYSSSASNGSFDKLFKKQGYILIKIEEEDKEADDVLMYVNRKGKEVEEAHFLIQSDEKLIVFSLYGKMRLKEKK